MTLLHCWSCFIITLCFCDIHTLFRSDQLPKKLTREEKVTVPSVQDVPFGRYLNDWWINVPHLLWRVHISLIKVALIGYIKVLRCSSVPFCSSGQDWKTNCVYTTWWMALCWTRLLCGEAYCLMSSHYLNNVKQWHFQTTLPGGIVPVGWLWCMSNVTNSCMNLSWANPMVFCKHGHTMEKWPLLSFCIFSHTVWQPQAAFPRCKSRYDRVCVKLIRPKKTFEIHEKSRRDFRLEPAKPAHPRSWERHFELCCNAISQKEK